MSIVVEHLTKRFGSEVTAVRDLSFSAAPGKVTGFLGPNGAGKTTTLRCLLGLVAQSEGSATIDGVTYREIENPITVVGASLEASGFHPARTARNHLRMIASAAKIGDSRVSEVLETVGLSAAGDRKVGGYSLGMRQRLALGVALLGDPKVLILDEPANGLDPEGISWLRSFLRHQASQGVSVLVSSHVLSEVQQTVDDVIIIRSGSLVYQGSLHALTEGGPAEVVVRGPNIAQLTIPADWTKRSDQNGELVITGGSIEAVGRAAFEQSLELHELSSKAADLEALFLDLTTEEGAA
ncbi:MAG: ATP-binding cassette domain-containing protein [Actinomycetia bacterium]|jgi:ABC-2 type transport system ATP-binding protein|nr:ATP-binding cassette domain-containing protein [Actinomycetes bacterium]MCH9831005.1 ATP-binding cassette domain-containing protein [Actinomycetes bacterium]